MFEYRPKGTCSTKISFSIEDDTIRSVLFKDGCNGNLKAISLLVEGMKPQELIGRLKGIRCGRRGTSCADQLARAVEKALSPGDPPG
ncbi:MAG: TIGR03905 family TSCPD domain-containing protein [Spirochaetaceae bacterium]|jgi:uncharacterized protein (TIGR03905 family)|nr:TIGR03905 family TSCPD domain-containing protein [Spirochaetaceae bacterium]